VRLAAGGWIGVGLIGVAVFSVLAGFIYLPHDPLSLDLDHRLQSPSAGFWLGTDQYGRDLFSRLLAAGQLSIGVSAATVAVAVLLGTLIGAIAGYLGGWTDRTLVMVLDAVMAFPRLLLVLAFLSVMGPSVGAVVVALGIAFTPTVARVVRSTVLSLRRREFVEASRVLGNGGVYTLVCHVLPNCLSPLIVTATTLFATALLLESALSFLGLGVPPPRATWGGLLADSRPFIAQAPWLSIFPGLAISVVLLGGNLLGDALRDALDPKGLAP